MGGVLLPENVNIAHCMQNRNVFWIPSGGDHIRVQFKETFSDVVSMENLLAAWQEFLCGKRNKPDVQRFRENFLVNIRDLHGDLIRHCYQHGAYYYFTVNDPKRRDIYKASVRDRLLHHAIYRRLYPFFDRCFASDSFSCRTGKGVHKAMD